nr:hypothetical protein BaRGS_025160 [Batillaria attramentaria]
MQDGNSISLLPSPQRQNLDRASEKQRQFSEEEMVDGNEDRFTWSKKREYLLSAMGFCVGIGNVWRFPYLCQRNGGGAFLIPFLLSLMLCGLPLYFLESAIGQFSGRSAVHVWSVCPLMKGTGIAINILALVCYWLYNTIMAWALYYLASSCRI